MERSEGRKRERTSNRVRAKLPQSKIVDANATIDTSSHNLVGAYGEAHHGILGFLKGDEKEKSSQDERGENLHRLDGLERS